MCVAREGWMRQVARARRAPTGPARGHGHVHDRVGGGCGRIQAPNPRREPHASHDAPPPFAPIQFRAPKEHAVYVMDASPAMQAPCGLVGVDGVDPKDPWLAVALRAVAAVLAVKIVESPSDEQAILLAGIFLDASTAKGEYPGVRALGVAPARGAPPRRAGGRDAPPPPALHGAMAQPSANRQLELLRLADALCGEGGEGGAGGGAPSLPPPDPTTPLADASKVALFAAAGALPGVRVPSVRRVTVLTCAPGDPSAAAPLLAQARTLGEGGALLDVVALVAAPGKVEKSEGGGRGGDANDAAATPFAHPTTFWGALLAANRAAVAASTAPGARVARARSLSPGAADTGDAADEEVDAALAMRRVVVFRSLTGALRDRAYRRVAATTLALSVRGARARAAVSLFQLVQPAKPPAPGAVAADNHEVVERARGDGGGGGGGGGKGKGAADGAAAAAPPPAAHHRLKLPAAKGAAIPASLPAAVITHDDLVAVKRWARPGIDIFAFANAATLAPRALSVRHPTFAFPAEPRQPGSTAMFTALWGAMLDSNAAALATLVRVDRGPARLVALLPRNRAVDADDGADVEPNGIDVIYLPWSDDVRCAPWAADPRGGARAVKVVGGGPHLGAGADTVALASTLIASLDLDAAAGECGWASTGVRSPTMARHWAVLEQLALGADPTAVPMPVDGAVPDAAASAAAAPAALTLRDAGAAADAAAAPARPAAKKRKAVMPPEADELAAIDARVRGVEGVDTRLKVEELKAWLRSNGLSATGVKAVLQARVEEAVAAGK